MPLIPHPKTFKPALRQSPPRLKSRWRRSWTIALGCVGVVVLLGCFSAVQAKQLYQAALGAKLEFDSAQTAVQEERFVDAATDLQQAENHLQTARRASTRLVWLKWLPWVHRQFTAVDNLLLAGEKLASAGQDILPIVENIFSALPSDDSGLSSVTSEQRRMVLEKISQAPDQLQTAQTKLTAALEALEAIPNSGVVAPLATITGPLHSQLPEIKTIITKAIPFLQVAPTIVGYPTRQTYLFLLQNNTELRPTGGFIGTYGILILQDGDIQEFKTDNIYNLDNAVKTELFMAPPEPMNRYLGSTQWFLRDANWNPDFPQTAQQVEEFYHLEHGPVEQLDGVIAVTPDLIHDLLAVTGPITIDEEEYTAENLTEKIQYQVEVAFRQDGVSDANRKAVIGQLASKLMEQVLTVPKKDWGDLAKVLLKNLDEKQVLLYSKNDQVNTMVRDLGWDGAIQKPVSGDFLMVIDANLAALKTDRVMTKTITASLTKIDQAYYVDLTLRYKNDGTFDFFTTRYRTYTRIYVPRGSQLQSSSGFLTNDRFLGGEPTTAETYDDASVDKTVFAGFISVEPKTEEQIRLRYQLPPALAAGIDAGIYELYWQKQPGTNNVTAELTIDIGERVTSYQPLDGFTEISNNKVHFKENLQVDQQLKVEF